MRIWLGRLLVCCIDMLRDHEDRCAARSPADWTPLGVTKEAIQSR